MAPWHKDKAQILLLARTLLMPLNTGIPQTHMVLTNKNLGHIEAGRRGVPYPKPRTLRLLSSRYLGYIGLGAAESNLQTDPPSEPAFSSRSYGVSE